MLMTLNGHLGEVWCIAVAKLGRFVVSCSADRSLRIWNRLDEQLFLEEERELEVEREYELQEQNARDREVGDVGSGVRGIDGELPTQEVRYYLC